MLTVCTLDAQTRNCKMNCAGCGFDLKELKMRQKMVAENKLTVCKDGLKRLIIKGKVSEE